MFERNRVDNRTTLAISVEISLDDGSVITGRAALPSHRGVHQLLDGDDAFLFVAPFDGEPIFVPKASVKSVRMIMPVRPQPLNIPVVDATAFDPYKILGVAPTAPWDEVRAAYHRLSKMYHPDLYAAVTLPKEVAAYLDGMTKSINAAFRAAKSPRRANDTANRT